MRAVKPFREHGTHWVAAWPMPLRVKKGCGQRKNRRDRDGRARHRITSEPSRARMLTLTLHGHVTPPALPPQPVATRWYR